MVSEVEAGPRSAVAAGLPAPVEAVLGGFGLLVAAVLEILALRAFARGGPALAFGLHLFAAGLFGLSLPGVLPRGTARPWLMSRLVGFAFAFFVPVLGLVGFGSALAWALHHRRPPPVDPLVYVRPPDLPLKPLFMGEGAPLRFSEGALGLVLKNAPDTDKRVAAVMALRRMAQARATPLLRIALRDPADDVRLLAYALNDGIDQDINRRIQRRLDALVGVPRHEQARLRKAIAQDYWDLAFLGLASGDVEAFVLGEAAKHLERALDLQPDGGAALLLGRIRLRQRRPTEAEAAFRRARALGLPSVAVGPYRAEAAFLRRRFDEVRARLADLPATSRARLPLAEVLRFWLPGGADR